MVALIQNNHEKAPLCRKKGFCRNGQRVFDGGQPGRGDDEHAGAQQIVRIGKVGLYADGACLGIERPVNGNYRGLFRVFGAVFQRNVQLAARLDAFIPVFPRLLNPFLLGDGEIDAYGIDGGDDGKGAAFRADQVADVCPGNAGYSVKRRVQHRIGKIFFSQGQGRRSLLHLRFRGQGGEARILVFLFGNGVLRGQGPVNFRVVIQLL